MRANSDPLRSPIESVNVEMKMIPVCGNAYRLMATDDQRITVYRQRILPVAGIAFAPLSICAISARSASLSAPPHSTICMAFSASTLSASSRATRSITAPCASGRRPNEAGNTVQKKLPATPSFDAGSSRNDRTVFAAARFASIPSLIVSERLIEARARNPELAVLIGNQCFVGRSQ